MNKNYKNHNFLREKKFKFENLTLFKIINYLRIMDIYIYLSIYMNYTEYIEKYIMYFFIQRKEMVL